MANSVLHYPAEPALTGKVSGVGVGVAERSSSLENAAEAGHSQS